MPNEIPTTPAAALMAPPTFGVPPSAPDTVVDIAPNTPLTPIGNAGDVVDVPPDAQLTQVPQSIDETKPGQEFDPLKDFSAQGIADFATKSPQEFDPVAEYESRKDLHLDPDVKSKVADAFHILRERGITKADVVGAAKNIPSTIWSAAKGFGKWVQGGATAAGLAASAPFTSDDVAFQERLDQARQFAGENIASTEHAMAGLAQMAKRGVDWAARAAHLEKPLADYDQNDKLAALNDALASRAVMGKIAAGQGPLTGLGETSARLKAEGLGIRPEEVEAMSAGNPFAWEAMGVPFKAIPMVVPRAVVAQGAKVGALAEKAAAVTAGKAVELTGALGKGAAKATEVVAPYAGAAGGTYAGFQSHGVGGAITGAGLGFKGGEEIAKRAAKVGAGFEKISQAGREIAGQAPVSGAYTQLAKDVIEAAPGATWEVAKGAAFDLGMAATTAETPQERQGVGFGVGLGLLGAGRHALGRSISGQIIGPRAYGVSTPTSTRGSFPVLEGAFQNAMKTAPQGDKVRMNAIRRFGQTVAPNSDIFYMPEGKAGDDAIIQALTDAGATPEKAAQYANTDGFRTTLKDARGTDRQVVIVRNIDSAPHEVAGHVLEDVLGEGANRALDEIVRQDYSANEWESYKKTYAERLNNNTPLPEGVTPGQFILEMSSKGRILATEKLVQQGLTPEDAVTKINADGWQSVLTPEEMAAGADQYIARELRAENADAWFKHTGPAAKEGRQFPEAMARVAANFISILGGEPLAGSFTSYGAPIKFKTLKAQGEAVRAKLAEGKPVVEPTGTGKAAEKPAVTATTEQRAASVASGAPDTALPGAAKTQREILGIVAEALADKKGVNIEYRAAPNEPAAATGLAGITKAVSRTVRRAVIEAYRWMPEEAREMVQKTFAPEFIRKTKDGRYQINGWAPQVLAANAQKLAGTLSAHPEFHPEIFGKGSRYEVDPAKRSFTVDGWRNLLDDVQDFSANQTAGHTGSGKPLVVPDMKGFYKPPVTGEPIPLDQAHADVINALFGIPVQTSARISGNKLPLNIAGKRVSEATLPGRIGSEVSPEFTGERAQQLGIEGERAQEVNPFRDELNQLADKPSFIEARQYINLEHIADVEHAPEQPQVKGNTLTLEAGFQPKSLDDIHAAAIRDDKTGELYTGSWHAEANMKYLEGTNQDDGNIFTIRPNTTEGFVDGHGNFYTREEAYQKAVAQGQYKPRKFEDGRLESGALEQQTKMKEMGYAPDVNFQPTPGKYKNAQVVLGDVNDEGQIYLAPLKGEQARTVSHEAMGWGMTPWRATRDTIYFWDSLDARNRKAIKQALASIGWTPNKFVRLGAFSNDSNFRAAHGGATRDDMDAASELGVTTPRADVFTPDLPPGPAREDYSDPEGLYGPKTSFQPQLKREIELEKDGKKYRATFDGYQDFSAMGKGMVPQITPLEDLPGSKQAGSTTYAPSLEKAGYKLPDLTQFAPKAETAEARKEWKEKGTESKFFKAWFGESKAVDEAGDPQVVYHGTTHAFNAFSDKRGNPENFAGVGHYFTSDPADARGNYAGKGPDLTSRIENTADQIFNQRAGDKNYVYGSEEYKAKMAEARAIAEKRLAGNNPRVIETYLKMENPVVIEEKGGTAFEYRLDENDQESGPYVDLYESTQRVANGMGLDGQKVWNQIAEIMGIENPTADAFMEAAKHVSELYDEKGGAGAFASKVFRDMGFDGIILNDPANHFPGMGIDPDAKHYVVFDPTQVKSVDNRGTFNPTDARYQFQGKRKAKTETERKEEAWLNSLDKYNVKPAVETGPAKWKLKPAPGEIFSKALILPDGEPAMLGGQWHHDFLNASPDLMKQYGLPKTDSVEKLRQAALQKGFVRVNYSNSDGTLTIELRQKDLANQAAAIENLVRSNAGKVDNIRVFLFNDKVTQVADHGAARVFDMSPEEKLQSIPFVARPSETTTTSAQASAETQFAPKEDKERILTSSEEGSTVRMPDGNKFRGVSHRTALNKAEETGLYSPEELGNAEEGYTTSRKRFVDRFSGYQIAVKSKQFDAGVYKKIAKEEELDFKGKPYLETYTFDDATSFQPKLEDLSKQIADDTKANGGATYSVLTGKPASADEGRYVVSAYPERSKIIEGDATPQQIADFAKANSDLLASDENSLGTWKDEGKTYVDVVISTPDRKLAEHLGKLYNQKAIWDAKNAKAIDVGGTGEPITVDIPEAERLDTARKSLKGQGLLFGGAEKPALTAGEVAGLSNEELKDHYPEAIVPNRVRNRNGELVDPILNSEIVKAPLYKEAGSEAKAVEAFSDKLVDFAKEYEDRPEFESGKRWYSEFVPMLKSIYGKQADIMAQLLAATSPNTAPETNFAFANEALEMYKAGKFTKQIEKFVEGANKLEDGTWKESGEKTEAAFLEAWIEKHDLLPRQSNGKRFGMHSAAVLQVLAGKWLTEARGLKTHQFIKNLLGTGHGATIDVWADRTMRRIGYAGEERWRILPKNQAGVADADFKFSQKAFAAAAKKLGMRPDSLQGALWFAEKQLWADKGWGRLDFGDFRKEIKRIPALNAKIRQRMAAPEAKQSELFGLVEPRPSATLGL